jgi:phosphoserine phosphatase
MDGVLTDILSSWKYIHDYFNTNNEESVDEYLKGKIDDSEFIRRDALLWNENGKPIKKERLFEILSQVPLMKGAKNCLSTLHENKIKTAIVSAGLDILAERVADQLGINYIYSNGIKCDSLGHLNGEGIVGVRLMYKDKTIEQIVNKLKISSHRIAAIGNSCFDIPMFFVSGMGIAFNPEDDCVREAADFVVENKNLNEILPYLSEFFG